MWDETGGSEWEEKNQECKEERNGGGERWKETREEKEKRRKLKLVC